MKIKLLITILALFINISFIHAQQVKLVSSVEVYTMLQNDKKWMILDVRTPEEFNAGHIKGAINVDIKQADAFSKIDKLDHNAKYIVHCRTYLRSKIAVDHMVQIGFKTIYQMTDGTTGWNEHHLPMTK